MRKKDDIYTFKVDDLLSLADEELSHAIETSCSKFSNANLTLSNADFLKQITRDLYRYNYKAPQQPELASELKKTFEELKDLPSDQVPNLIYNLQKTFLANGFSTTGKQIKNLLILLVQDIYSYPESALRFALENCTDCTSFSLDKKLKDKSTVISFDDKGNLRVGFVTQGIRWQDPEEGPLVSLAYQFTLKLTGEVTVSSMALQASDPKAQQIIQTLETSIDQMAAKKKDEEKKSLDDGHQARLQRNQFLFKVGIRDSPPSSPPLSPKKEGRRHAR